MKLLIAVLLATGCAAAPVYAQAPPAAVAATPEPRIAPIPDWVERIAIPAANPALGDRPFQLLLSTGQSFYGGQHNDHFVELAFAIQNAQGLQGLGNVILPWQPDQSDLIVHKIQIVRNGAVIDLLAAGQRFTVLRRENNLESAVLDGFLTAVMQPEGLAVGDVLNIAFTMRLRPATLPLRAENLFFVDYGVPVRRLFVRQIWPEDMAIRWRGTGLFDRARNRRTRLGNELVVDLTDAQGPQPPAQAPTRFAHPATLQLTQFRDWTELSADVAPHYQRAAALEANSPLRREIERIAAASPDPRLRTMAALRLVQDQVRYFALVMGAGNYLPAAAEQSWARRFADCKGKAVLLVALLRELGVTAEPVLVNAVAGDTVGEMLPMMNAFNHVIVRAEIGGRSYWLDGTRNGDRSLDDLASSTFSWGLPIRASGAILQPLPYAPPSRPLLETNTFYDGSGGFNRAVPVRVEQVLRGDGATQMRTLVSQLGRDEFLRRYREGATAGPAGGVTITSVDLRDNPDDGTLTIVTAGTYSMRWNQAPGGAASRYRFDNDPITWTVNFDRPAGPFHDVPFAFPVPTYTASTETVILPNNGQGYSIEGESFDHLIAGTRISRRLAIADGRATAHSEFRRIEREVAAAAAYASKARIDEIGDDGAFLRAPRGAVSQAAADRSTSDETASAGVEPTTARGLVERGHGRLQSGNLDGAEADFTRAAALEPTWSRPLANRAIVLIHRGRYDEAEPLLARAATLDPSDFVVPQGRGLIHLARNQPVQAVAEFTRSLGLDPDNKFTLFRRSAAYQQVGELDGALADLAAILVLDPGNVAALATKARIHAWRGEAEPAIAAADALVATDPNNPALLYARAGVRRQLGRPDAAEGYAQTLAGIEARLTAAPAEAGALGDLRRAVFANSGRAADAVAELSAELARRPDDPDLLNSRCWTRATANLQLPEALADCERALVKSPNNAAILDSRAFVRLRLGQIEGALADENAALAISPQLPAALYIRGIARLRRGDRAAGERDLAAARRLVFDIDARYRDYGVTP